MSEQKSLAVIPPAELVKATGEGAQELMRRASDVAGVCREIVMRTAMELQGKKYVKVEGWQSMATAFGCSPSIKEVVEEERGIRAVAELKRHDGTVLASAEGYCGLDEPRWANQPLYARRGMAQTRAISRVCRSVFAFVVVLIDENLSTTPAEEIPSGGEVIEATARPVASAARSAPKSSACPHDKSTKVKFGKTKGECLCAISDDDLAWQLNAAKKAVDANDPKWGDSNKKWLVVVQAEASRRAFPEATGRREVQPDTSPKRRTVKVVPAPEEMSVAGAPAHNDDEALELLSEEFGISKGRVTLRAKGILGKTAGFTQEEIETLRAAIRAVPPQ